MLGQVSVVVAGAVADSVAVLGEGDAGNDDWGVSWGQGDVELRGYGDSEWSFL